MRRNSFVITALLLFAGISFGQTLEEGGTLMVHEWNATVDEMKAKFGEVSFTFRDWMITR